MLCGSNLGSIFENIWMCQLSDGFLLDHLSLYIFLCEIYCHQFTPEKIKNGLISVTFLGFGLITEGLTIHLT